MHAFIVLFYSIITSRVSRVDKRGNLRNRCSIPLIIKSMQNIQRTPKYRYDNSPLSLQLRHCLLQFAFFLMLQPLSRRDIGDTFFLNCSHTQADIHAEQSYSFPEVIYNTAIVDGTHYEILLVPSSQQYLYSKPRFSILIIPCNKSGDSNQPYRFSKETNI